MGILKRRSVAAALIGTAVAAALFTGAESASANVWQEQNLYYSLAACQADGRYGVSHLGWTSYACDAIHTPSGVTIYNLWSLDY
ncbi:hypothetical protein ABH926_005226 [Catenulispora sp. GP43]|uniref:hypothetical protein n=1 Tax=Catenulispora sp. GP43 TaxID=3156263 RepID=UPI0035144CE7